MPRPAARTRILSLGAGATAVVAAVALSVAPASDLNPLGAVGRAEASAPAPTVPSTPQAFGVEGVDLASLGYSGPDLGATTLPQLNQPLADLPTERAADVRDRIGAATPHLRGLHQAKNLLRKAAAKQDHHVYAAKVAVSEAEEARVEAVERFDSAMRKATTRVSDTVPGDAADAGAASLVSVDDPSAVVVDATGEASEAVTATVGDAADEEIVHDTDVAPVPASLDAEELARRGRRVERLAADAAEARATASAAWRQLEDRRERHRALHDAAAAAESELVRFDDHLRWLQLVLSDAQSSMPSAGNWLVIEERKDQELPIVEVRGFQVHASLAGSIRQLVDEAAAAGIDLKGKAYRPQSRQIELRRQNCGASHHDIFEKPSGQCSPPTAKPGRSLHELGLAFDFRNGDNSITSRSDPAFRWLARHAPVYGLYNLPAEPWHWSVTSQ